MTDRIEIKQLDNRNDKDNKNDKDNRSDKKIKMVRK